MKTTEAGEIRRLEYRNDALEATVAARTEKINELEDLVEAQERQIAFLQDQDKGKTDVIDAKDKEIDSLRLQLTNLTKEYGRLKGELESIHSRDKIKNKHIQDLAEDARRWEDTSHRVSAELVEEKKLVVSLTEQLNGHASVQEQEDVIAHLEAEVLRLEDEVENVNRQNLNLQSRLENSENTRREHAAEWQRTCDSYEDDLEMAARRNENLHATIAAQDSIIRMKKPGVVENFIRTADKRLEKWLQQRHSQKRQAQAQKAPFFNYNTSP